MSLGTYIKTLRRNKHWTQSELAKGITTKSMVSQLEQGKARPSHRVIIQLLLRLDADITQAVREDAVTVEDWKQWADALLEEQRPEEALHIMDGLLKQDLATEEHIEWLLKYALAALRLRQGQLALRVLTPLESELEERKATEIVTLHHYLGCAYAFVGDPVMAYHYFEQCEQGIKASGPFSDVLLPLRNTINAAYVLMQMQHYEEAKLRFYKARSMWNDQVSAKWKGFVCHYLSVCLRRLGEKEASSRLLNEALFWYRQSPWENRDEIILLQGLKAQLLSDQGKHEEAIRFLSASYAKWDLLQDQEDKIDLTAKLAEFHYKAGRIEEALALLRPVLKDEYPPSPALGYAFHVCGLICRALSRYQEALKNFSRAAEIFQKRKRHLDMDMSLREMNHVLHDLLHEEWVS